MPLITKNPVYPVMSWFLAVLASVKRENIPIESQPLSKASCRISTED
jgi:hypothetical protein